MLRMWNVHAEWCRDVSSSVLQRERGAAGTATYAGFSNLNNSKQKTRKVSGEYGFRKG